MLRVSRAAKGFSNVRGYASAASPPKRRVGAVRGGILGFLLGTAACIAISERFIENDFMASTRHLAASVNELRASTEQVREYADIVERVDRDFHQLRAEGVKQKDLEKLKNEVYRLHDIVSRNHVELKARVSNLENEVHRSL